VIVGPHTITGDAADRGRRGAMNIRSGARSPDGRSVNGVGSAPVTPSAIPSELTTSPRTSLL
jgi:hypothetical protein